MPLHSSTRETMTERDREEFDQQKLLFEMQSAHSIQIKKLELELAQQEVKWSSWMKIPVTIVKLPVYIIFGLAYAIAMARKYEPSQDFWRFIK